MKPLLILLILSFPPTFCPKKEVIIVYTNRTCLKCYHELKDFLIQNNINGYKICYYYDDNFWVNKSNKATLKSIFGENTDIDKINGYKDSISPIILVIDRRENDTFTIPYQKIFNQNGDIILKKQDLL